RHHNGVTSVAFKPDGSAVISSSHDHSVKCTSIASGQEEWTAVGSSDQVNSVALSLNGSLLVTGSSDGRFAAGLRKAGAEGTGAGAVRLWNARAGRLLRRLGDPADQILAVAISPDGQRVAAGGGGAGGKGVVQLWNAESGTLVWSARDHASE